MAFNDELKRIMKHQKIGNNKLSIYSGIASSTISYITQGKRNPKPATLKKLAHGLRVPYSKLLSMAGYAPKMPSNVEAVNDTVNVPIIGDIHCGSDIDSNQNITGHIPFPKQFLHRGSKYFVLNCIGNSMSPQIKNKTRVLCKVTHEPIDGSIEAVVFMHDGDTTEASCMLKRVHVLDSNKLIYLTADNPDYKNTNRTLTPNNSKHTRIAGIVTLILARPK